MSSDPNSRERCIGIIEANDIAGRARWLYVLLQAPADEGTAGPVVLNVTTGARDDDPHGWCGDTFWLTTPEAAAVAAALRRAAALGETDSNPITEFTAPDGTGESAWLRLRTADDATLSGHSIVLDFVVADPTLSIVLEPASAAALADALDRAGPV